MYPCITKIGAVFIGIFLVLCLQTPGFAYQINLEWDPNLEDHFVGYIVYYGEESRLYDYNVDVGDETTCIISGLSEGITYYFAVTAYDAEGNESFYSKEIVYLESEFVRSIGGSGGGGSGGGGGGGGCFIASANLELKPLRVNLAGVALIFRIIVGVGCVLTSEKSGKKMRSCLKYA